MTNKLGILLMALAFVSLPVLAASQDAIASICFDCPAADLDVDAAEAENTTSAGGRANQTGTNSTR